MGKSMWTIKGHYVLYLVIVYNNWRQTVNESNSRLYKTNLSNATSPVGRCVILAKDPIVPEFRPFSPDTDQQIF